MQILYSVRNDTVTLLDTKQKTDKNLAEKIFEKFPSVFPEFPIYVSGTIGIGSVRYAYKALGFRCGRIDDGGTCVIHAFAYELSDGFDAFGALEHECFFSASDVEKIIADGADYKTVRPSMTSAASALISDAAVRYTLASLYDNKPAVLTAPDDVCSSPAAAEFVVNRIRSYFDMMTAEKTAIYVNTMSGCGDGAGVTLVSENMKNLPDSRVSILCEEAEISDEEAGKAADYLVGARPQDRSAFLKLLNKYGRYCKEDRSHCVSVYDAFIGFDEELIYDLVHSFCRDMYEKNANPDIDAGTKAMLRQYVRDRAVIRSIYSGYTEMKFIDLIAKNKCETAFYSSFRSVGSIFMSDDAESCNVMLASRLTEDKSEAEKAEIYVSELETLDCLSEKAENPFELGMILSYRKIIVNLNSKSEFLQDVKNRVLSDIGVLISGCDGEALFADGTDLEINKICEREGVDRREYFDDIEQMKMVRYREILTSEIERSFGTEGKPVSTFDKLYGNEFIVKSNDYLNRDGSDAFKETMIKISGISGENYREVYYEILKDFGDPEKAREQEELIICFKKALASLFGTYSSFKSELIGEIKAERNDIAKLLTESNYSFAYCYALESCDVNMLYEMIKGFEPSRVDRMLFYPMFYTKIKDLSRELESIIFIEELDKKTDNETARSLLHAAKLATACDTGYKTTVADIDRIRDAYPEIEKYVNGDICIDLVTDGESFWKIPVSVYVQACADPEGKRVRVMAEGSAEINNFLAFMGVEGYVKVELQPTEELETEVTEPQSETVDEIDSDLEKLLSVDDDDAEDEPETGHDEIEEEPVSETPADNNEIRVEIIRDDNYEAPAVLDIMTKKKNGDALKIGIAAASILTLLAVAAFIVIMVIIK